MAILRFLYRFTSLASRSIGANVRHSWNFMHKRSNDMEEEATASRALNLFAARETRYIISSCWHVCSGKNFVRNFGRIFLLGTARASKPSHTTIVQ